MITLLLKFLLSIRECKSLNVEKQGQVNFPIHHSRHIIFSPFMGKILCAFFDSWGNFSLLSWLRHSKGKISFLFLHIKGLSQCLKAYRLYEPKVPHFKALTHIYSEQKSSRSWQDFDRYFRQVKVPPNHSLKS